MSSPTTIIVMTSRKHHLERADRWLRSAREICTLASAVRSAARVMLDWGQRAGGSRAANGQAVHIVALCEGVGPDG